MAWTYPISWTKGALITVADLNTYLRDNMKDIYTVIAVQTETLLKNNSAAFSDLVGMSFSVLSGEVWSFHAWSYWNSGTTPDAKWTVTAPAASTGRFGLAGGGIPLTAGNETTFGNSIAITSSGSSNQLVNLAAYITAGANGTIQLQAAQNTATAADSNWYLNSFIIAHRVSA